jgi:hypothetical protein
MESARGATRLAQDFRGACAKPTAAAQGLALSEDEADPLLADALRHIAAALPAGIEARVTELEATAGALHADVRYFAGGTPLCRRLTRLHRVGERVLVDGELPRGAYRGSSDELTALQWDDKSLAAGAVARALNAKAASRVSRAERCIHLDDGKAEALWDLSLRVSGLSYRALASSARVADVELAELHVTGTARIYRDNPATQELVDVELKDLQPGAALESTRFKTSLAGKAPQALADDRRYAFEPDDPRFQEVTAFANAEAFMAWAMQPFNGYDIGCAPIEVRLHQTIDTPRGPTKDNARYLSPDETDDGQPRVEIGDGDTLQNLSLDFDVIAHELGHHVLARRLITKTGEPRAIHEGLADYLVYAKTGNPCLGESICGPTAACELPNRCLRTADNRYRLDEGDLSAYGQAQALSGMLWDLGKSPGIGHSTVARLVFKAVDYFLPASGFHDMLKALMAADLELHGGVNACALRDQAEQRGLAKALEGIDCTSYRAP